MCEFNLWPAVFSFIADYVTMLSDQVSCVSPLPTTFRPSPAESENSNSDDEPIITSLIAVLIAEAEPQTQQFRADSQWSDNGSSLM